MNHVKSHPPRGAASLLQRLAKVRQTAPNRWIACCPAHDDHKPSLAINETPEGLILIRCFAECSAVDIMGAVGMEMADLFPEKLPKWEWTGRSPRRRRAALDACSALSLVANDSLVVAVIATDIGNGKPVTAEMREKLFDAAGRLAMALELSNVV